MNRYTPEKLVAVSRYQNYFPTLPHDIQRDIYSRMEKRGSRYLRYALYNATKYVCIWDRSFAAYLAKKRAEGKHYNVAISHAAKKLVRLIFALQRSGQPYCPAT